VAAEYEYESKPLPDPGLGRFGLGNATQWNAEGFFSKGQDGGGGGGGLAARGEMISSAGASSGLPSAIAGDILYHDGDNWVRLGLPSGKRVLMIDGGNPYWAETEDCD
jgi:hypothetical protein